MKNSPPLLLIILDGFGLRPNGDDNAIFHAKTPNWTNFCEKYAFGMLSASEEAVGLPPGQFGNSEVGHLNIGAGRIVRQELSRIDHDIATGHFGTLPTLMDLFQHVSPTQRLHVMGLLSDGGVHSHERHLHALLLLARDAGVSHVVVHAFLDGRDTPPRSASRYLERLNSVLDRCPQTTLASICGRYWAMDRDCRWERLAPVCDLLLAARANYQLATAAEALDAAYLRGENDEFVKPTIVGEPQTIQEGDSLIFMNFRADRARQLTSALSSPHFSGFKVHQPKLKRFLTLTSYGADYDLPVLYPPFHVKNGLGEYLSHLGLTQLRIAETEKYAHVTYFFNGGEEKAYPGEERILVPSPKVASYDLQPEMSARLVTDQLVEAIGSQRYHFIVCNYANGDMVGHTGDFTAAVKAVEELDRSIGRCVAAMQAIGGEVMISADHGNCETMYDAIHQQAHTQHTLNPVPFLYIGRLATVRQGGALCDIAPAVLHIMGLDKPSEMTGESLLCLR